MHKEWKTRPLKEVLANVIDYRGKAPPKAPDGVRLITARNVRLGSLDLTHAEFIEKEQYSSWMNRGLPTEGDILFTTEAPLAHVCMFPEKGTYAVGQRIVTLRPDPGQMNSQFLCQYLLSEEGQRKIDIRSTGSTAKGIKSRELIKVPTPVPPLREQRKIAAILRTWDEALEKLNAQRAAKAKRHVGLTHSLVFGGMQLEEFRGSNEAKSYRWFQLPAVWGCKPIGDLAVEISERNTDGDALDVLSCSKHDGFVRSLEYFKKQVFSADLTGYKKISRGDFGFPSNHVEEGSIGLQNLTEIGVVSPIYTVFRFDPSKVLGEYAFAVLKTEIYRHIFEVSTSASVDRRGSLRWKEFARLPFPVPPLAEQEAIAEVLHTSKSEIDALDAEIEATSRQKRGLMQKLLTGEWRVEVSDDEEAAA